ncbi:cac [Cordylochernes scorpioides]|uniref:Cac n=1 Tax=Cordylochernes scorpioides TaxID=51811 RepID=A0ABY6LPQ8_9ARAC|nr:cac [Cordylochernes scorpioides]
MLCVLEEDDVFHTLTGRGVTAEEMDQADMELRETLRKLWPLQARKMIDKLVPPDEGLIAILLPLAP